jgi:hypothetical protein
MPLRRLLAGVLLAGLAGPMLGAAPPASPPAEPSAGPARPAATLPSPEIAARARAVFDANRSGKLDRSAFTTELNAKITGADYAHVAAELRALGDVRRFVQVQKITVGTTVVYVFRIECEKPPVVEETIAWDDAGKVELLQFGPAR